MLRKSWDLRIGHRKLYSKKMIESEGNDPFRNSEKRKFLIGDC